MLSWQAAVANPPYTVSVVEIKFNHNTGSETADGVTIKTSGGSTITSPEWTSGGSNKPVVYTKGSSKTIKVKFSCTEDDAQDVAIWATKTGGDRLGSLAEQSVDFTDGYSGPVSYTIPSSSVPTAVKKKGTVEWTWKFRYPINLTAEIGTTGPHTIYTTYGAPVSPEPDPRVNIVEYATDWADGKSTTSTIAVAMIQGVSQNYKYDGINCMRLASDYVRLVGSTGVNNWLHCWAGIPDLDREVGDMFWQETRVVDPIGPGSAKKFDFRYHVWAEAGNKQRDPSFGLSRVGSWGGHEDWLFTRYQRWDDLTWLDNQSGQSSGVEDYQAEKCIYKMIANPAVWFGPNL